LLQKHGNRRPRGAAAADETDRVADLDLWVNGDDDRRFGGAARRSKHVVPRAYEVGCLFGIECQKRMCRQGEFSIVQGPQLRGSPE